MQNHLLKRLKQEMGKQPMDGGTGKGKEVMVPAQGLGLPCGSWDVEELPKGPPRLKLRL